MTLNSIAGFVCSLFVVTALAVASKSGLIDCVESFVGSPTKKRR